MRTCDVLVVGAGIAGCAVANELASAGASVVVAERGAVCSGSSALNAGGVRQQFSQEASVRAGMETIRRLKGFQEEFGVDPAFRQAGYWTHLDNVYTIAGFGGHGMCLAPGLAAQASREILGGSEEQLGIYRLDRFERGGVEPEGVWGGSGIAAGTASAPRVGE